MQIKEPSCGGGIPGTHNLILFLKMSADDLDDFFLEGGDELLNTEECPKCGGIIYLDRPIEWVDEAKGTCICPHCGENVRIAP